MKIGSLSGASALLLVAPAVAQVPSAETMRRYPPVVSTTTPLPPGVIERRVTPEPRLQRWMPGDVRCDGARYPAASVRRPWTVLAWGDGAVKPVVLRFRIDREGRALGIVSDRTAYAPFGDDIAPSLAATRFPAADERRGCSITYAAERLDLAQAPFGDVVSYSINPTAGPLPRDAWDRINQPDGDCNQAPRPHPLNQAFPDFDKVSAAPGARDWVFMGYDLNAKGRPVNVRVLSSTGNRMLDTAGVAALGRSRYTGGPRQGCRYHFWKGAIALPAPPAPEPDALRPADATCRPGPWKTQPALVFPEQWRRRGIEGWAIVAYDVAPWGATGNVRALAAEPAAEFGERAVRIIRAAAREPSAQGMTGCVERARFRMGPDGDPPRGRD